MAPEPIQSVPISSISPGNSENWHRKLYIFHLFYYCNSPRMNYNDTKLRNSNFYPKLEDIVHFSDASGPTQNYVI